jgi:N-acetylated-alpha-linked acidic dipeptidase
MSMTRIAVACALAIAALVALAASHHPAAAMFGFTRPGAIAEAALERRFLSGTSARRMSGEHQVVAAEPHIAGSERDHALMLRTRDQFTASGFEHVEVTTHDVLLPWPEEVVVEMTAPVPWCATMREDAIAGDADTAITPERAGIPYHAYSASGDVTASVIDAGHGDPADYAALERRGVDARGKIVLVRNSVPYSYRGFKALTAEQRGAVGILIYSDPADEPRGGGRPYPAGPWAPPAQIQRGAVAYDFIVPGDPLTPGWASVPGARRVARADAPSLPRIVSAPLSYNDAHVILEARDPIVHMRVRLDDRVRPVWTVTGMIRGSERPDELVIVGNHRDAWVYGGVDPSSGSVALMELARGLGALAQSGWRPKRSILFASWDAEEFALTSSTEWGEQHAERLTRQAVAYINVDSAASGSLFTAMAVPALNRVIAEAAQAVRDPEGRASIAAAARDRRARDLGTLSTGAAGELVDNRLGGGSDYTVFLNHLGIPIADISFTGPYGVYHSLYDTRAWLSRIGDPGFRYHVALAQIWGVMTLRLANADALPLDYAEYADRIAAFVNDVEQRSTHDGAEAAAFEALRMAAARLQRAAASFGRRRDEALEREDAARLAALNASVLTVERALLDPEGLPGRSWYRHLVYAPKFTYAPDVLPGVSAAIDANDTRQIAVQARRLAAGLDRAARALE